jgi:predicted Kef-type K+ transport protein
MFGMRLILTTIVGSVALVVVSLWRSDSTIDWVTTGFMGIVVIGLALSVLVVRRWLRNRQRRRLMEMQDSALW